MATTPPVPDHNKIAAAIAVADNLPKFLRDLTDSIKSPDGKAVHHYKDLHVMTLEFKDMVNGLYATASAADKSLQTGKRKEAKTEGVKYHTKSELANAKADAEKDTAPKADKKSTRAERKEANRAKYKKEHSARASNEVEPEVTTAGPDEP